MTENSRHPIPRGRRAALNDDSLWVPMKGIVSRMTRELRVAPELAGEIIWSGMEAGTIGHQPLSRHNRGWIGDGWVVNPSGAATLKRKEVGFSYETGMDWDGGCMVLPGSPPLPMAIFWPDVECAVDHASAGARSGSSKPDQAAVNAFVRRKYEEAADAQSPPPKAEPVVWKACQAFGGTQQQFRAAMELVPEGLKNARGRRRKSVA